MSAMDSIIRRAAGRGPRTPAPPVVPPAADEFTARATEIGVAADLLDLARGLVGEGLSGAALTSSLQKLITERPGFVSPGHVAPERPDGLDGGARMPREDASGDPSATMNTLIRQAAGRQPEYRRGGNGVSYPVCG